MSVFNEPINYEELENDLNKALKSDELYSLQNDAKFRAIEQGVPSYEDFRQMVNAAHLKPLERRDMNPKTGVKWNSIANESLESRNHCLKSLRFNQQSITQISSMNLPKNCHEFRRIWKELIELKDKFKLLNDSRQILNSSIFRSEIPPEIFSDCIRTCLDYLKMSNDEKSVLGVLTALAECNRFTIAVAFMSIEDKTICKDLFAALRVKTVEKGEEKKIVDVLEEKYTNCEFA